MPTLTITLDFLQQQLDGTQFGYRINKNGQPVTYELGNNIVNKTFEIAATASVGRIIRTNSNLSIDNANFGSFTGGGVYDVAQDTTGNLFVTGGFTYYPPNANGGLVILNQTGTAVYGFQPGADGFIYTTVVQPDGKILVGGNFQQWNGQLANRLYRFNADYSPDTTFNTNFHNATTNKGANGAIHSIALQGDGKILIGGGFSNINNNARGRICRLNPNGTVDTTFAASTGFNGNVLTIEIDDQNRIYCGGDFSTFNNSTAMKGIRLTTSGLLDPGFNVGAFGFNNTVRKIKIDADKNIMFGGNFTYYDNRFLSKIVKLTPYGSVQENWVGGTSLTDIVTVVNDIDFLSTGEIIIGGNLPIYKTEIIKNIVRLNSNGQFENATRLNDVVRAIKVIPGDKIVIGGEFTQYVSGNNGSTPRYIPIGTTLTQTIQTTLDNLNAFNVNDDISYSISGNKILVEFFYNSSDDIYVDSISDIPTRLLITVSDIPLTNGNMVLTRSPHWISVINNLSYSYVTLKLWVYRGIIGSYPSVPTYTFTKYKVIESDPEISFNISPFIDGLINPKLTSDWFSESTNFATNNMSEAVFVHYEIIAYAGDLNNTIVSSRSGDKIATRGWGTFIEGANPTPPTYILSDVSADYISRGTREWKATLTIGASMSSTGIIVRDDISSGDNTICEAKYDVYQIVFLNKYGVFEGFSFPKVSNRNISVERKEYYRLGSKPQSYQTNNHYQTSQIVKSTESISLNTNLLKDADVVRLNNLFESDLHYLVDENYKIFPVILKESDFPVKTQINLKANIQYTIRFEFANNAINNIT